MTTPKQLNVVTIKQKEIVVIDRPKVQYVTSGGTQGLPGPRGIQGPPGTDGGSSLAAYSNVPIGGHRFVYLDNAENAQYASNEVLANANTVLGMTAGAANAGYMINVIRSGEITEPTWNWTLNAPVFLGINGLLTQTQPESPALFSLIVGFPITATKLFVSIREPIVF
jgi:hypothetical protein